MNRTQVIIVIIISLTAGFLGGYIPSLFVTIKEKVVIAQEYRIEDSSGNYSGSIAIKDIMGKTVIVFKDNLGKVIWKIPPTTSLGAIY